MIDEQLAAKVRESCEPMVDYLHRIFDWQRQVVRERNCGCKKYLSYEERQAALEGIYAAGIRLVEAAIEADNPRFLDNLRDWPYKRQCATCGETFYAHDARMKYCGWWCRAGKRKQDRAEQRHKTCEGCGNEFEATRADAKFCRGACRQLAYRQRVEA